MVVVNDRLQLIRALNAAGVKSRAFSVSRSVDMAICLDKVNGGWVVFYSERGEESPMGFFKTEAEACAFMYEAVINDPTSFI